MCAPPVPDAPPAPRRTITEEEALGLQWEKDCGDGRTPAAHPGGATCGSAGCLVPGGRKLCVTWKRPVDADDNEEKRIVCRNCVMRWDQKKDKAKKNKRVHGMEESEEDEEKQDGQTSPAARDPGRGARISRQAPRHPRRTMRTRTRSCSLC